MEITYRRQRPHSRLEHLLARLLLVPSRNSPSEPRVDMVRDVDVEFRRA